MQCTVCQLPISTFSLILSFFQQMVQMLTFECTSALTLGGKLFGSRVAIVYLVVSFCLCCVEGVV